LNSKLLTLALSAKKKEGAGGEPGAPARLRYDEEVRGTSCVSIQS